MSELARQPFDGAEFPFAFLAAFGNKETTIKRLRKGESNASDVPGGVLQRSHIHLAVCAASRVGETLRALRDSPKTVAAKAKFILATDGEMLEAEDLAGGETIASEYRKFADYFGFFCRWPPSPPSRTIRLTCGRPRHLVRSGVPRLQIAKRQYRA